MDANSEATLRQMIRTRLAAGSLVPVDGKVAAGKGTGKPCIICRMPISADHIEHEVVGPTTIFAHRECYSIWRQESDALAEAPQQAGKTTSPLHIDREDGDGVNPHTSEYALSFGGSKDRVGTVLIAKLKGLDALRTFLERLEIAASDIESACRALIAQSHHDILNVRLRLALQRSLRDSSSTS